LAYGLLRQICRPSSEFPSEQINNLYFDTFDLEQHERSASGDYRKTKCVSAGTVKMGTLMGTGRFSGTKNKAGFHRHKKRFKLQVPSENLVLKRLGKGIIAGTLLMDTLARFGYFPLKCCNR